MSERASASIGRQQRRALDTAKGILMDWDGCIAIGNEVLPLARLLISQHAERVAIVSNNSTHLPADFEEVLAEHGLAIPQDRIFLAGAETIRAIAEEDARVLLLSAPRMMDYARGFGITLVQRDVDLVVLMRDATFSYAKLDLAANAIRSGARLIVANTDMTHPGPEGRIVPETGALLAALQACAGEDQPDPRLIGKPGPFLFERACAVLGLAPRDTVMIGDNPATDGKGAENAGIQSILIGGNSPLGLEDLIAWPDG